jgi:hypothetical protein
MEPVTHFLRSNKSHAECADEVYAVMAEYAGRPVPPGTIMKRTSKSAVDVIAALELLFHEGKIEKVPMHESWYISPRFDA